MTRILSYNIFLGGTRRVEQLSAIIRSARPDIVGLVEATNAQVVEELAVRLSMQYRLSGQGKRERDWHLGVLSRLPILHAQLHTDPATFTRRHILEVCVEGAIDSPLTIFVAHLTASFNRGPESNRIRRAEVQEILRIMASRRGTPHLLMGDFNSITPGDPSRGSAVLGYILGEQAMRQEQGQLVQPAGTWFRRYAVKTTLRTLLRNAGVRAAIDHICPVYAQGGFDLLRAAGYVDCFRYLHPRAPGFTFPAAIPACRIDYIFASPELAARLSTCDVVTEGEGVCGGEASDHLPLWAEFGA